MAIKPLTLVTSAGGKTGMQVALQLRDADYPVRAFLRTNDARAQILKKAGAEVFVGNQYALTDMRVAMQGVQRAYQCAPTAPNGLHFNAVFTAAAFEAGVEHVVTLSQWLSSVDHPSLFTREVYLSDILIGMRTEMSVTTINVGWFADNYLMVIDMAAHLGMFTMPLGTGDQKNNAPPSNEDIASVAVGALIDPETHAGKTYRPTGPALLSPNEIAGAMGQALGRRVSYRDISEQMMLKAMKAMPPSNYSEATVSQLAIYTREYRRGAFAVNAPTQDVLMVGGRTPEPFDSIVRRTVASRPDLSRSIGRSLGALGGFMKLLATRPPNLNKIAETNDFAEISKPVFTQDDPAWHASHHSQNAATSSPRAA